MAYLLQHLTRLVEVAEHRIEDYLAAGFSQPSPDQVAAHLHADPYQGTQGVPPAPALPSPMPIVVATTPPDPAPVVAETAPVQE